MEGIELRDFAYQPRQKQDTGNSTPKPDQGSSRLVKFWKKHIRITIEEAASRDHLALERTYLAYIRTASAFAQFGVTIAQLFKLNDYRNGISNVTSLRIGRALGATVEGIAILVLLSGAFYFAQQQTGLMKGVVVSRGYHLWVMTVVSVVVSVFTSNNVANLNNLGIAVRDLARVAGLGQQMVRLMDIPTCCACACIVSLGNVDQYRGNALSFEAFKRFRVFEMVYQSAY